MNTWRIYCCLLNCSPKTEKPDNSQRRFPHELLSGINTHVILFNEFYKNFILFPVAIIHTM